MTNPPSPRSAARSEGRPPRRLLPWIAGLLVVALGAGAVIIWLTPVLGVRQIQIDGTGDEQIIAQVRDAIDVADGTPLARLDTDRVAARAQAVPAISAATAQRTWPNTLVITVTVRSAVASTQANGQWWLLDREGIAFGASDEEPADLIPLKLATPGPADRATIAALAVLASLSDDIRGRVAAISATAPYDVQLELGSGRIVIWGSAEDADAKNEVLPALLKRGGKVIDISDPTLVTVSDG